MLRAAVVGAGHQGRYHALKYAAMHGVRVAAVVDVHPERARRLGAEVGAPAYSDHRAVASLVDVASVAVPVAAHLPVGRDLLEAGVHVLMEKPIAATVAGGRALAALADARGLILRVGHVERFNPVVAALRGGGGGPSFIEAQRLGAFTGRGMDTSVVLDLMIHDIDLVLTLVQHPVIRLEARGIAVLSPRADIAWARLGFADGSVASLTASRVSPVRRRRLTVFRGDGYCSADLDRQVLHRGHGAREGGEATWMPEYRDVMRDELSSFLSCVSTGAALPVSAGDGVRALATALDVAERADPCPEPERVPAR
ncbi:MAG: Gfo/Idh/MocA family oxidoreductase [Pseudomonadota bacterium]